jgi:hypothetical protein
MLWLVLALGVAGAFVLDRDHRLWSRLVACAERAAVGAYALYLRRRRARALAWVNDWRSQRKLPAQREWRKGVPHSREHGIIACNLEVVAYGGGFWVDRNGVAGGVPRYVAAFARDFDEGMFPELVGRVVPVPAAVLTLAGARKLGVRADAAIVA